MKSDSILHCHAQALEHLLGYQTDRDQSRGESACTALDHFTIAASHEAGTPVLDVARQVGETLGWSVYDRELLTCIAKELQLPVELIEGIDERRQSWLLECLHSFVLHSELSESRYFRCLSAVIRSLGEK